MAQLSVVILVCLLSGLTGTQAKSKENETLAELTEEDLTKSEDTQNFNQVQEVLVSTSNTAIIQEISESPINMLKTEVEALRQRLESSEKQLAELKGLRTMDRGNEIYYSKLWFYNTSIFHPHNNKTLIWESFLIQGHISLILKVKNE